MKDVCLFSTLTVSNTPHEEQRALPVDPDQTEAALRKQHSNHTSGCTRRRYSTWHVFRSPLGCLCPWIHDRPVLFERRFEMLLIYYMNCSLSGRWVLPSPSKNKNSNSFSLNYMAQNICPLLGFGLVGLDPGLTLQPPSYIFRTSLCSVSHWFHPCV